MKKKILLATGAMVVAGGLGLALSQLGVANANPKLTHDDIRNQVIEMYPGTITELEIAKKGSRSIYEVEIELDDMEYELEIDGDTGEVLKLERQKEVVQDKKDNKDDKQATTEVVEKVEVPTKTVEKVEVPTNNVAPSQNHAKQVTNDSTQQQTANNNTTQANKTVISRQQAINIALGQFSGTVQEVELDDDHNRLVYEIEIENGNSEADIKIDAYTGQVIVIDVETDDDNDDYDGE